MTADGTFSHSVKNTGSIAIAVDMGYGPMTNYLLQPGLEQGLDRYITAIGDKVIPPAERVIVTYYLQSDSSMALKLTYGAPTALSSNVEGMSAGYEIRAYKAIWPCKQ